MFEQHITWFNPFAQRQLSHIMLEGYMFFLIAKGGCERRDSMIHFGKRLAEDVFAALPYVESILFFATYWRIVGISMIQEMSEV